MSDDFDPARVRPLFPALARRVGGHAALFLDAPGGTQAPQPVVDAVADYLAHVNANYGGVFATSRETSELVAQARAATAAFLNSPYPDGIVFGANMTTLTFAFSRALARTWRAGDEVVVTSLDHDANVASWMLAAEDRRATVRTLRCEADGALSVARLREVLSPRTRVVALTVASNAIGTIPDLAPLVRAAHDVGALVFLDAVHAAPHLPLDVLALECDALACSAYKFGGPHLGILWAQRGLLEQTAAYKVRPSPATGPGKWETGTQSFEAIAGLLAVLRYLGGLGADGGEALGRLALERAMQRIQRHELALTGRFLTGARTIPGLHVHGIADPARSAERTPTFGLTFDRITPQAACERLAARGVFAWAGNFYAIGLVEQLGLAGSGGLLRLGFAHYHDAADVDRALAELKALAG
ncbi:MAG TPA: cysteine desulfurase-like protein [Planctomycetota bacterium]|nr:cysteine desulfurase-like protein [Planctomycetota bacterium]